MQVDIYWCKVVIHWRTTFVLLLYDKIYIFTVSEAKSIVLFKRRNLKDYHYKASFQITYLQGKTWVLNSQEKS